MTSFNLFSEAEHELVFWDGGRSAALLVHGFPGTPAEMRSLGRVLQEAGCTVQALLAFVENSHSDAR